MPPDEAGKNRAPGRADRLAAGATRVALLLAAMEEFAAHGVSGTTVRQITAAAGARNPSALHYHFGNKAGLLNQLVAFVQDWFDRTRAPQFEILEARLALGDPPSLRDSLDVFVRPYARLITEQSWGLAAIRFIATVEFEQQKAGWETLYRHTATIAERHYRLVMAATGHEGGELAQRRMLFFYDSVIQGFAMHKHLKVSFFGNLQPQSIEALADFYVDCGARLLSAEKSR
jgi:AcrR family transcriptional regulator